MSGSRFILASSSPRRLQLVNQIGYQPDIVMAPDVDETELPKESPTKLVERLALLKASVAAEQFPGDVVLAADTVAYCRRQILTKPNDAAQAENYLQMLSGRRHRVYTGVCVRKGSKVLFEVHSTIIQFKRLHADEITEFVKSEAWKGNAGGYAISGLAAIFIKRIDGLDSTVAGLPLMPVSNMLRHFGLRPNKS